MPVRFKCPSCSKVLSTSEENRGKKTKCPGCQKLMLVPRGAPARVTAGGAPGNDSGADADLNDMYDLKPAAKLKPNIPAASVAELHFKAVPERRKIMWPAPVLARFLGGAVDLGLIIAMTLGTNWLIPPLRGHLVAALEAWWTRADLVAFFKAARVDMLFFVPVVSILWFGWQSVFTWKFGASPGKMLLGMRVTDTDSKPVEMKQALVRSVASLGSAALLLVGFAMAAFSRKRQALHDLLAGTLVVKRE